MIPNSTNLSQESMILPTVMGDEIKIQAKGKTTIIYFFAPWCQICHASISNLQAIYEKNEAIDVIAVGLDYINKEEIEKFTQKHQLTFPIAFGNETIKKTFQITGYPSYYVLNDENTVIGKSLGYSSELGLYIRSL
jgi:thiol-disulfide isomerase/thioredoxin